MALAQNRVPNRVGVKTYKEAPLSDMRGSVAWANGWNACLAKIKEMRDG